jgi:hypothetical protein
VEFLETLIGANFYFLALVAFGSATLEDRPRNETIVRMLTSLTPAPTRTFSGSRLRLRS